MDTPMKLPVIHGLDVIKYPPGTKMVANHNHSLVITITEVSSWHGYDTVVWKEDGLHIYMNPQYTYEHEDKKVRGVCDSRHLDDDYTVVPDDYVGKVIQSDVDHVLNTGFDPNALTESLARWLKRVFPNIGDDVEQMVDDWKSRQ